MFTLFLILLIVGVLAIQHFYKQFSYSNKLLSKLPGPPTLPFFGHAITINDSYEGQWRFIRKGLNEYYPIVCFWIFSKPLVFIRHPDDIEVLIKSKVNIDKSNGFYHYVRMHGIVGLITIEGKKWHNRRKLINQAFLRLNLKSFIEITNKYAELLIQQISQLKDGSIENVLPLTLKFSLDIIFDATMGYDLHTVGAPYEKSYVKAFKTLMDLIMYRSTRPYLKNWMFKLLPAQREITECGKISKAFSKRILDERRNYHKTKGIDLLSDNFEDTKDKSPQDLNLVDMLCIFNAKGLINEEEMIQELETLVAAAYDTTGLAIAYTLLLLAENEHEQNLARAEVQDIMTKSGNRLTFSDVNNLQYLERCVKETLRLFPSAPLIGRQLLEDTKFGNYVIPRNTDVYMGLYDLHRDPNYWPEPNKFNPDRFLPEFSKDRHPYAYLPFSGGLRNCIGQKHSMIEIKVAVAHILHNFYLKPVDFTCDLRFDLHVVLYPTTEKLRVKFIKI